MKSLAYIGAAGLALGLTCSDVAAMPDSVGQVPEQPQARLRDQSTAVGTTWWRWTGDLLRPPALSFDAPVIQISAETMEAFRRTVADFAASVPLQPGESTVENTSRRFVLPAYYLLDGASFGNSGQLKLAVPP